MKIYIVTGSTGEYSDRSTWTVRAFVNYRRAKKFALNLAELAREHGMVNQVGRGSVWDQDAQIVLKAKIRENFDPHFSQNYTGTEYYVSEDGIELDEDPE